MYEYPMHQIRYGSKITIKHCVSGQYLTHGEHIPIEPGSQLSKVCSFFKKFSISITRFWQFSFYWVTYDRSRPATNEVWIVTSPYGENKIPGDPVHCNSIIGLKHEATGANLHADQVDDRNGKISKTFILRMIPPHPVQLESALVPRVQLQNIAAKKILPGIRF